ncbi:MAG: SDR family oxidoreductase [bacterium]|nr:SDR family oxidoreductase [bacterium]
MNRLEGKTALITGAASGIGAACALRFAREGARIAGFDIDKPADGVLKAISDVASDQLFLNGDVRDEENVAAAVSTVAQTFGSVDIVLNAAGVAGGGPVHMVDTLEWERVLDINLKGTFLVCKHVLRQMLEQGSGSIINVASVEGLEGAEGGSAYNASKGGVILLTRNLAIDYGRRGIRANAICPGFIRTPLLDSLFEADAMKDALARVTDAHQLGRLGEPSEIAGAAAFLASEDASFVTGHALAVDGGFTAGHRIGTAKLMGLD